VLTAPNFFGVTNPNFNPGGEFIFLPVFLSINTCLQPGAGRDAFLISRFNGFVVLIKPLKRLAVLIDQSTGLKPNVNERTKITIGRSLVSLQFNRALCILCAT